MKIDIPALAQPHLRRHHATAALLVLALLAGGVEHGQAVSGTIPAHEAFINGGSGSLVLETARGVVGSEPGLPAADRPAAASDGLRHLPASLSGWRINGEIGTLQWPVYLASGEAASTRRFRLTYRASASVLPGLSTIVLTINDVVVGRAAILSPASIKPVEFDIPPDLLRRGFNAVRISIVQRHRVDCSLDATYELWTQVVAEASGFLLGDGAPRPQLDASELAALRPRRDGAFPIQMIVGGRLTSQQVDRALVAAQAIAMAGRFQMPVVSFSREKVSDAGVRLLLGTAADIAAMSNPPAGLPPIAGPTVLLLPDRGNEPPTLLVSGATEEDMTVAVARLAALAKADIVGTPAGWRLAMNPQGLRISGGERVRLSDLGLSSIEFSGRFFRLTIDVAMPADFLAANYDKLTIDLAGGYAAGLNAGAQVRVEINGRNGASVALPNPSGDFFRHNKIFVPLGLLRPGANRIEILAELQNQSDSACEAAGDHDTKRFLLLDTTEIRFPSIAQVGRTPDLLPMNAAGFPYATSHGRPTLHVPTPDKDTMSAAFTLAVRLALAAHDIIPFAFTLAPPANGHGHSLMVAPAQALDPQLMRTIGLDPDTVRRAWERRAKPQESVTTPAPARVVLRSGQADPGPPIDDHARPDDPPRPSVADDKLASSVRSHELADQWLDMIARDSIWHAVGTAARSLSDRGVKAAERAFVAVRGFGAPDAGSEHVNEHASLIVAQGYRPDNSTDVVTIVTASDPATLSRAIEVLMEPSRWSGLRGRLSVMNSDDGLLFASDAAYQHYVETQPATVGNIRLIVAGWFSLNPLAYIATALLTALMLAIATLSLVRNVGRRN